MRDPTRRGEIHLGDLARALAKLQWRDDEQARAIAACLGFGLQTTPGPRPPTEIYDRQRYPRTLRKSVKPPPERPLFVPPTPEPPPLLPANSLECSLQPLAERAPGAPDDADWLDEEDALFTEYSETRVAREPICPERTNRHLLSAALATLRTGQEIDVSELIAAVCRREAVRELPRRPEPTLETGCQLLLDYSATMVPFWEDLNGLIGQVADVVGIAATRVFSFDTKPTEAVRRTVRGKRESWKPEGRPVLAATDLGIQGRSGRVEPDRTWHQLAERCATERIPLVILIPWPEARWPLNIGGSPELVHWSPHTSAAMLRRKIGLGHRLG
jgi:hypothetical protein